MSLLSLRLRMVCAPERASERTILVSVNEEFGRSCLRAEGVVVFFVLTRDGHPLQILFFSLLEIYITFSPCSVCRVRRVLSWVSSIVILAHARRSSPNFCSPTLLDPVFVFASFVACDFLIQLPETFRP